MRRLKISFSGSLLLLMLLVAKPAFALPDYRCVIERIVTTEQPPNKSLSFNERNYLSKRFTVERRTGLMTGALKNAYLTEPQVIDIGSNENSFKVITTMRRDQGVGAGSNVYLLTINEHSTSPKKPFVFVENDLVFLGVCEHF